MQKLFSQTKFILILTLILSLNTLSSCAQTPSKSLYDRLGGLYPIAAVVDDFVDRLLINAKVAENKNVTDAMEKITKAGLKYRLTEFICANTGGPQKYTGRPMKASHATLNISEAEWQEMVKEFVSSLGKFKVPQKEQDDLIGVVVTTKGDIVTAKEPPKAPAPLAAPAPEAAAPIVPDLVPVVPAPEAALPEPVQVPPEAPALAPPAPALQAAPPQEQVPTGEPFPDLVLPPPPPE